MEKGEKRERAAIADCFDDEWIRTGVVVRVRSAKLFSGLLRKELENMDEDERSSGY